MQCHGSFATASCTVCKLQVPADAIKEDIFERRIPLCPRCKDAGGEEGDSKDSLPAEPSSASPAEPSISGKASTSSTSDLEVPEPTANTTQEGCEKPSAPSYVPPKSVMKPDIVFFGEGLPDHFHQVCEEFRNAVNSQWRFETEILQVLLSSEHH